MSTEVELLVIWAPFLVVSGIAFAILSKQYKYTRAEALYIFLSIIVFVAAIGVAIAGAIGTGSRHSCKVNGDGLNLESRWSYATLCQVQVGDIWIDIEKYRYSIQE